MKKRGQVTIFIIVAIVIIVAGAIIFFVNQKSNSAINLQGDEVGLRVESCLENSLALAIVSNSLQGGYFDSEESGYYFEDGKSNVPSKEDLENNLLLGVEGIFGSCLNFSDLPGEVKYDLERAIFKIEGENNLIKINLRLPITLKMDDSSLVVDEFSSEIETDYFNFYNVAVELTQEQEKHVDEICLSCATDIAGRERVSIVSLEGQKEGNDILIYTI